MTKLIIIRHPNVFLARCQFENLQGYGPMMDHKVRFADTLMQGLTVLFIYILFLDFCFELESSLYKIYNFLGKPFKADMKT